jgi:hypothetical protein
MAEMSVFANASVKVQFRTSLPTEGQARLERQQEYAELLKQLRTAFRKGLAECQVDGWEAVVVDVGV